MDSDDSRAGVCAFVGMVGATTSVSPRLPYWGHRGDVALV